MWTGPDKADLLRAFPGSDIEHLLIIIVPFSLHNARFTLADPTPRLYPDAVGSANVNGFPTRNRLSGPNRETIGRSSADREPNVYNATVFQREL